jgi:hypothetical protein
MQVRRKRHGYEDKSVGLDEDNLFLEGSMIKLAADGLPDSRKTVVRLCFTEMPIAMTQQTAHFELEKSQEPTLENFRTSSELRIEEAAVKPLISPKSCDTRSKQVLQLINVDIHESRAKTPRSRYVGAIT